MCALFAHTRKFSNYLNEDAFDDESFRCVHVDICKLIWGEELEIEKFNDNTSLVEVVRQAPQYKAVIHPPGNEKGAGVIVMTSKTLKPKCVTCLGRDSCIHIRIHLEKYQKDLENVDVEDIEHTSHNDVAKDLRTTKMPNIESRKEMEFDPFTNVGVKSNVFGVKTNCIPNKKRRNKKQENLEGKKSFQ